MLVWTTLLGAEAFPATIQFQWDYPAAGATGFALYCWTAAGQWVRRDAKNALNYAHTELTEGAKYTCAVTAYDADGLESGFSNAIPISVPYSPPNASFAATPGAGTSPLTVRFTNQTTGSVSAWQWDFGDGTRSTLKTPTKIYSAAGSYRVTLTATGPGGSNTSAETPIEVAFPPPAPGFRMSTLSGTAPLAVAFTNLTTGPAVTWAWDFGDADEIYIYGTNPAAYDTDGDGIGDGEEVIVRGTNPLDPNSGP